MSDVESVHDQAVAIIEELLRRNVGGNLDAVAQCNQCGESLQVNLVEGISEVRNNRSVEAVRPDLSLFDIDGKAVRFVEVVDKHAPERNVHQFAIENDVEVFEVHLAADREFTGARRNKALDESLTIKARLRELSEGRVVVDAHNRLCSKPKCLECGSSLPLRVISVSVKDCWKCGQNVNVATGSVDGAGLQQDDFTDEEVSFAKESDVTLERRFSATTQARYLANVCTNCDQIQGNWFLYMDPFHDRFNLPVKNLENYGPCVQCSTSYCFSHGEYVDYRGTGSCPVCVIESERVMCPNVPDRECFYPDKCEQDECFFEKRERVAREAQEKWEREAEERRQAQEAERQRRFEEEGRRWFSVQEWFDQRTKQAEGEDGS